MIRERVKIVDAIRGLALLGIVVIHSVEHFELFKTPLEDSMFITSFDKIVHDVIFFLVAGKAYSMFAILFGFSFFIQLSCKEQDGIEFKPVFLRRMLGLFAMGIIHSIVYRGDILHIYALMGLPLLLVYRVKTQYLIIAAILLAAQLPTIYLIIRAFTDASFKYTPYYGGDSFKIGEETYAHGSFWEVLKYNLWSGRVVVWTWTYHVGRFYQLFAFFFIGMILGRMGVFYRSLEFKKFLINVLIYSALIFLGLTAFTQNMSSLEWTELQLSLTSVLVKSYTSFFYTVLLMASVLLLSPLIANSLVVNVLAVYGRMSLTNYVAQAVLSVTFFYGFGFGMYAYLGAAWSVLYGLVLFLIQVLIGSEWLKKYKYGPLEWVWRAMTLRNFNLPLKKIS
ncbi:MAG: DUF418 domain-containing protein [Reichenbachiella sp.]